MKSIAVQIVTYNSEKEILNCLKFVEMQSHPINDIIVIDNNSIDNTTDLIKSSEYFKKIDFSKNSINNGFAGGHNQAFFLSGSDYVLVLNPDVELHPDYINHLVKRMEQNPRIGAATGKLYRDHDCNVLDSTGLIMKKNRRAIDRGSGEVDRHQYDDQTNIFGVSGAAALYRREMINDVSVNGEFFDETFFAYKEDVDVAWRAQLFGWKAIFVPDAIATHKRGWQGDKKRSQISHRIRKHSYINRYYTIMKNDSLSYFLLHLPIIFFYEVLSLGYAIVKEREILSAWKDFGINYSKIMEKRKLVKQNQKLPNSKIFRYFKGIW